jgi:hypothetical protein
MPPEGLVLDCPKARAGTKTLRYIIGDKKGILLFINLIHGKLRTPKNKRLNELIEFLNMKYSLKITLVLDSPWPRLKVYSILLTLKIIAGLQVLLKLMAILV